MSEVIDNISNHIAAGLNRLMAQYRNKPVLQNLLTVLLGRTQDVEDMLQGLQGRTNIAGSVGAQLDGIGYIVGQPRNGEDDATYRALLLVRIAINVSRGTTEDIIGAFVLMTGASLVELRELYPAAFQLSTDVVITDPYVLSYLPFMVQLVKPAAVDLVFISYFDSSDPFEFASQDITPEFGNGFGDISDPSIGGKLGALYS